MHQTVTIGYIKNEIVSYKVRSHEWIVIDSWEHDDLGSCEIETECVIELKENHVQDLVDCILFAKQS